MRFSLSTLCCVSPPNVVWWKYNTCNGKQPKTYLALSFAFHSFGVGGENRIGRLMGWVENRKVLTSYRAKETQLGESYFNVFPIKINIQVVRCWGIHSVYVAGFASWKCKLQIDLWLSQARDHDLLTFCVTENPETCVARWQDAEETKQQPTLRFSCPPDFPALLGGTQFELLCCY